MISSSTSIPVGGGSLIVAWRLKDKRVLIVGGGDVASGRLESVLAADANITLIAPKDGLHTRTKFLIDRCSQITYHDRIFRGPEDLRNVDMVLTAIDDVEASRQICTMCRDQKIPINVADIPPSCDFYFGSQIRRGPLQVMISTGGNSPKLANIIKTKIEESLPDKVDEAIEKVGVLRTRLRKHAPGVGGKLSTRRMRWMTQLCDTWTFENLASLDDEAMENLLVHGWENNVVPLPPSSASSSSTKTWKLPQWQDLTPTIVAFSTGMAVAAALSLLRRR